MLLVLLTASGHAAPCIAAVAADQVAFAATPSQGGLTLVGGKLRGLNNLNAQMQQVIDREMAISYHQARYLDQLRREVCTYVPDCVVDVITQPRIEVIPARRVSQDFHCNAPLCTIGYHFNLDISTTRSEETGFAADVSIAPFEEGVMFSTSSSYGFRKNKDTTISYEFRMEMGDSAYIAMVNAQISAKVRLRGSKQCNDWVCYGGPFDITGYHEAVIMHNDTPKSIVALVYH
ncbi:hypothetical protein MVEG_10367 [Podila verticillata NRRL 6337]|nr:hypothetical protein MVEG_10367 [Podila verticillata NRRL 6337]